MSPKDQALHTLGRAVVNFQRLESSLRRLAPLAPLEGTLESAGRQMEKRLEEAADFTFGKAIGAWEDVLNRRVRRPQLHSDLFSITLWTSIKFPLNAANTHRHLEALRTLLEERNRLIHAGLELFNWDSDEDCLELHQHLERLNLAIDVELKLLGTMAQALRDLVTGEWAIQEVQSET